MNADHLTPGCVWSADFDFEGQGFLRKKYFVLLTDGDDLVFAITTSNGQKRYPGETTKQCGTPRLSCYRIECGQERCFTCTTWIQFDNSFKRTRAEFEALTKDGGQLRAAAFVHKMDEGRTRGVLSCAKNARDMRGREQQQIERTLKTLQDKVKAEREAKLKRA